MEHIIEQASMNQWVVLLALPVLGIVSTIAHNLPKNSFTKALCWVLDLVSANIQHSQKEITERDEKKDAAKEK